MCAAGARRHAAAGPAASSCPARLAPPTRVRPTRSAGAPRPRRLPPRMPAARVGQRACPSASPRRPGRRRHAPPVAAWGFFIGRRWGGRRRRRGWLSRTGRLDWHGRLGWPGRLNSRDGHRDGHRDGRGGAGEGDRPSRSGKPGSTWAPAVSVRTPAASPSASAAAATAVSRSVAAGRPAPGYAQGRPTP